MPKQKGHFETTQLRVFFFFFNVAGESFTIVLSMELDWNANYLVSSQTH